MPRIPDALQEGLGARYTVEAVAGQGGMATVYRAKDLKHGRLVALKVLHPDLAESVGTERFLKEIEIAARLSHPHILPLYDSGETNGFLYYVMPFVDGESLRGTLNRVRLMDTDGALEITRRVADALDYAHKQGVLHRDIKPENLLLPGGHAVVADFGIAKALTTAAGKGLTRTGIAVGSPGYMSPEQAAGLPDVDERTDVYSLGVVAYEMLVGGLPGPWVTEDAQRAGRFLHVADTHRAILDRLPRGMEWSLLRALAIRPDDRFPTPGEFASALAHPEDVVRPEPHTVEALAVRLPVGPPEPADSVAPTTEVRKPGLLGAPTMLTYESVVNGEVPQSEHPALVEEARATFGFRGHTSSTARSLIWSAKEPKAASGSGPDLSAASVRVSSRGGQTRIRVEQQLGEIAGGVFGGVMGGGGVGLSFAIGGILGFATPALLVPLVVLPVSYLLARTIFRSIAAHKGAALESLADRLAEHCEEVAR